MVFLLLQSNLLVTLLEIRRTIKIMKKFIYYFFLFLSLVVIVACDDTESYGDKRKAERNAISHFISEHGITLITPEEFENQDTVTDLTKNQFVYNSNTEVYFQIVERGSGPHAKKIETGERRELICRFTEVNILNPTEERTVNDTLTNTLPQWLERPEVMMVTNSSGTYSASFTNMNSLMVQAYGSSASSTGYVPEGWLAVLPYIKVTRQGDLDVPAKVRLIVPSTKGQATAMTNVYPCYYEITFEGGRQ